MNMLRKHIKVEPARYYYHCDKLGLLVWQDMPSAMRAGAKQNVQPNQPADAVFSADDDKQWRAELKAMIDHLRFFPCIIAWVPFNEGWGQHDTNEVLEWVMKYDPTRLVAYYIELQRQYQGRLIGAPEAEGVGAPSGSDSGLRARKKISVTNERGEGMIPG